MALTYASDRYPWRRTEVISSIVLAVLAAVIEGVGLYLDAWPLAYLVGPIAIFLALFYILSNVRVKVQRTLNVELNDESGYFNVWMNKENRALWGDKLKRDRNQGDLHQLQTVGHQHVGVYGVFVFALKGGKNLYLPERGVKPEVAKFFREWIANRLGGKVNFANRDAHEAFERAFDVHGTVDA